MPAADRAAEGSLIAAFNNHGLFSNYYLEDRLPSQTEWSRKEHVPAFEEIKAIYERERPFLRTELTEAQLEERFLRPILRKLGFEFEVQQELESDSDFPDYVLFKDRAALDHAKASGNMYATALALGEAKRWDLELDRIGRDRQNKRRNPSFQVWLYLQGSKTLWGILVNGRKWRLYRRDRMFDTYYEVDLINLIEVGDVESFRYFYYFFRKEAFLPGTGGVIFLDLVYATSEDHARAVGENLKENVYRAVRILAQGFFDRSENQLDITNSEHLQLVQANVMRLIYRLLFILYAEGRNLLSDPSYYQSEYSLYFLKREIARKMGSNQPFMSAGTSYWIRLRDLFRMINLGSEASGVPRNSFFIPPYNGGLFSPAQNLFLENKVVGDPAVADAIDLLARTRGNGSQEGFVDFSTLGIRHLGSIYEGLLEYRIQVAQAEMVAAGDKLLWMPYQEYVKDKKRPKTFEDFDDENRVPAGRLYVGTHSGERKATGSYYTPEEIVKFIVEKVVGPIVEVKWAEARARGEALSEATLSLEILDPAMGSGHFLVGVADFLAAKLLKAIELDVESGQITETEAELLTYDWAKREVVSRCIFGVDLNELAVELTKVSLWLITIGKDKPLSFLDHHLKRGDSLLGAKIVSLPWLPKERPPGMEVQLDRPMGLLQKILDRLMSLESIPDNSIDQVKQKERLYNELKQSDEYKRVKSVADVHVGLWFTRPINTRTSYGQLVEAAYSGDTKSWLASTDKEWAKKAANASSSKHAFHWELEFPEVFFENGVRKPNAGFDAVVGNPPYVSFGLGRVGKLADDEEEYLRFNFDTSAEYKISTYALFMQACIDLSRDKGMQGLILPDSFLTGRYFSKIRSLILDNRLVQIVHFDEDFWEGGDVGFPVIWIGQKENMKSKRYKFAISFASSLDTFIYGDVKEREVDVSQPRSNRRKRIRLIRDASTAELIQTIEGSSKIVSDFLSLHHGVRSKVGRDKIVTKRSADRDSKWKKGLIESNQVTRFHIEYREDYILIDPELLFSGGWDSTKIEVPKILIRRTGDSIISAVDYDKYYHTNALIFGNATDRNVIGILHFMCAVLNSKLFMYYYRVVTSKEGRAFPQVEIDALEELSVPLLPGQTQDDFLATTSTSEPTRSFTIASVEEGCQMIQSLESNNPKFVEALNTLVSRVEEELGQIAAIKKEFLNWLEVAVGGSLAEWPGHTTLDEFYTTSFDDILELIHKNEDRSQLKPYKRQEDLAILRSNFDTAVTKARPIAQSIEGDNLLIDLIVYRLYGLSPEQVAKIENTSLETISQRYQWSR